VKSLTFIFSNLSKSETTTNPSLLPTERLPFATKFQIYPNDGKARMSLENEFI